MPANKTLSLYPCLQIFHRTARIIHNANLPINFLKDDILESNLALGVVGGFQVSEHKTGSIKIKSTTLLGHKTIRLWAIGFNKITLPLP
jgi:hypothetical protein